MKRALVILLFGLGVPGSAWADAPCAVDRLDIRWADGRETFAPRSRTMRPNAPRG